MNYAVEVSFNHVMFIEAEDKDTASEEALDQFEEMYGLAPGQAFVEEIKEVK